MEKNTEVIGEKKMNRKSKAKRYPLQIDWYWKGSLHSLPKRLNTQVTPICQVRFITSRTILGFLSITFKWFDLFTQLVFKFFYQYSSILVFCSVKYLQHLFFQADSSPNVFANELLAYFKCFIPDRDFTIYTFYLRYKPSMKALFFLICKNKALQLV